VARPFALDAARHLSFRGRYWSRLAVPDRWSTWRFAAVPAGMKLIREHRVQALWSTFPLATAHMIGARLARRSRLPWIADFRDPMVEHFPETGETFPKDPLIRQARLDIEADVVNTAECAVFCTATARAIVQERYSGRRQPRLEIISNGYEEKSFEDARSVSAPRTSSGRRLLLHSGTVYPGADRDPTALFKALGMLAREGLIAPENFELRLRDPSHVPHFHKLAAELNVTPFVSIEPPLPYREALAEMMSADALLLLQGITSNPAIPGKLYEYLRARRPILALVHPAGETARTLRELHMDASTPLTDPAPIANLLRAWLRDPARAEAALPPFSAVEQFSRFALTAQLAKLLDASVERQPASS
jgi:hypothetical protein